uniref:Neur_chan_LBD domain-containing protein n=1 Tax=Brugia timori TaxID=42155 RepID=A0A0R3QHS8_9BILA
MLYLFNNYYAPFLLSKYVRIIVVFLFAGWLSSSFAVMGNIPLGFDQKMAVPEGNFEINYSNSFIFVLNKRKNDYHIKRSFTAFPWNAYGRFRSQVSPQTGWDEV